MSRILGNLALPLARQTSKQSSSGDSKARDKNKNGSTVFPHKPR